MISHGVTLALGTDNGMFSLPSIFREMEAAYKLSKVYGGVDPMEVLRMATINPRRILGMEDNFVGGKARLIVFRRLMTPYEIVNKASSADIKRLIL
jgi:cytosine/adenosine deaminase-related metal-dependent hydrolase